MTKKMILAALMCAVLSPAFELDSNTLVGRSYQDFMSAKQEKSGWWYTGTVIAGWGAVSLVAASHFDGIAALHRNQAARYFEAGNNKPGYLSEREQMLNWKDRRDIAWQVGLGLGLVGGTIMGIDLFANRNQTLTLTPVPNGLVLAGQF